MLRFALPDFSCWCRRQELRCISIEIEGDGDESVYRYYIVQCNKKCCNDLNDY